MAGNATRTIWNQPAGIYLAPSALFRIGQQKLTVVDMSVDKMTAWQYLLARELYSSWGIGPDRAAAENPVLPYDDEDLKTRQYIRSNHLEEIADFLIHHNEKGQLSLIRFSEFSSAFFNDREFAEARRHITCPLTNFTRNASPCYGGYCLYKRIYMLP
jgi:hypothetical protein